MPVDLSLAVNYIPACVCIVKAIFLFVVISIGKQIIGYPLYVMLVCVLVMDRVVNKFRIMDVNAVLWVILGYVMWAEVRRGQLVSVPWYVSYGFYGLWGVGSLVMIIEPSRVRKMIENKFIYGKYHALACVMLHVCLMSCIHMDEDWTDVFFWKVIMYTLLCVSWVYIVGVYETSTYDPNQMESGIQFTIRMWPALSSPPWVFLAFSIAATAALVIKHRRGVREDVSHEIHVTSEPYTPLQSVSSAVDEREELHKLLNAAKSGARLNTIPELSCQ